MKKIKIIQLLTGSFLACNAYATESKDILFSVFGTEMRPSEMVARNILVKKNIECANTFVPGTEAFASIRLDEPGDDSASERNEFSRANQDVYQLNFSSSDGACLRLKIETEDEKTKISLSKIDYLKSYAVSAYDYAGCVDYVLSGKRSFEGLDDEGKFSFIPCTVIAGGDHEVKAGRKVLYKDTIVWAGNNISYVGTVIELKNSINSSSNEIKLEVMPELGLNPIIRSMFITSPETASSYYTQKPSYRASLIDGVMDASAADISVYKFEDITINFDASIVDA